MKSVKQYGFALVTVFFFLCGICGTVNAAQSYPKWSFAVYCDTRGDNNILNVTKSGVNEAVVNSVARDIVKEGAELVIFPGDLVNGNFYIKASYASQFASWRKAMAPVYEAGIKVYPIRGNHEDGPFAAPYRYPWPPNQDTTPATNADPKLKAAYLAAFSDPWIPANGPEGEVGLTYSFVHKNAFFVGLDQLIKPFRVNQPWLDEQFRNKRQPHAFVYGHAPAFRVGHTDSLAYYPVERDRFWNSLGNAGVRMYFSGHDHLYNRAHVTDQSGHTIYQVLTGAGGAPFNKWNPPYAEGDKVVGDYHKEGVNGYVLVTVDGSHVAMKWKTLSSKDGQDAWRILDSLEYTVE